MRFQVTYDTNIDYDATIEKLCKSVFVENGFPTQKGHFSVKFRGHPHRVLITHTGKIQVMYSSQEQKDRFLPLLKRHLVTKGNQPLRFDALNQSILSISYPGPRGLQLSWCSEWIHYLGIQAWEWFVIMAALGSAPLFVVGGTIMASELSKLFGNTSSGRS